MPARSNQHAARSRSGGGLIAVGVVIAILGVLAAVAITLAPVGLIPGDHAGDGVGEDDQVPQGAPACTNGPPIGGVAQSFSGSEVTSCGFAEAMRQAYGNQGVRNAEVQLGVTSPVSGDSYQMTCKGSQVITCTGGQNARIYLQLGA